MKKWTIITAVALAVIVAVAVPLAVFAQGGQTQPQVRLFEPKGALALVAPRLVTANETVQVTVFLRRNQTPVADAGIWLVTQEKAEALKTALKALRDDKTTPETQKEYQKVIELHAERLGATGPRGRFEYAFKATGSFALIAFKPGSWPDSSPLAVRESISVLAIKGRARAAVDTDTPIQVTVKGTNRAVENAGVWAVKAENIQDAKAKVQAFKETNKADPAKANWESELDLIATRLGTTDANGKLTAQFDDAGRYLLIAYKPGFVPGLSAIVVIAP